MTFSPSHPSVVLGVITGTRGLKGEVRVRTFTQTPEALFAQGPLTLRHKGAHHGDTVTGHIIATHKNATALVHLDGVHDRTTAEALKGAELLVERARMAPPQAQEYYHADLIGLDARDAHTHAGIGVISAVLETGANSCLDIALHDTGNILVPFTRDAVPHVALVDGYVEIAHMDEWLALNPPKSPAKTPAQQETPSA